MNIQTLKLFVFLISCFGFANFSYSSEPEESSNTSKTQQTLDEVNINSATAETLAANLKGIGLKKAEAIVKYRETYGDFAAVAELADVKGIGEKIVALNNHRIKLN